MLIRNIGKSIVFPYFASATLFGNYLRNRIIMSKPVIAVDIDEVLAHLIPTLAKFHNEHYDGEVLTADSFGGMEFHNVWGGTQDEAQQKMDHFFVSDHFKNQIGPVAGAFAALSRLKDDFDLQIVTARQSYLETETQSWISTHFPNTFSKLHFGNHFNKGIGKSRSKAQICKEIDAVLLIDDSIVYATQCASAGIPVLLFGDYAWNQEACLSGVADWRKFQHYQADPTTKESPLTYRTFVHEEHYLGDALVASADSFSFTSKLDLSLSKINTIFRVRQWSEMCAAVFSVLSDILPPISTSSTTCNELPSSSNTSPPVQSDKLLVAAIQMCSISDKQTNLASIARLVKRAASERPGVQLVCLPECCVFMGTSALQTVSESEYIPHEGDSDEVSNGGSIRRLCEIAVENKVWLSVGGFPERRTVDEVACMSNTHVVISPEGLVLSPAYRKIHLFDSPLAGLQESKHTVAGSELVTANVSGLQVGLAICYDLRFPAFFEALCRPLVNGVGEKNISDKGGAEVVLVPSAFTQVTGKAHWEVLLRARAIENQCYIVAAAQSGQHNEKRASHGHTMIIDPWGTVVAQLFGEDEGVCYAELSKENLRSIRNSMPVQTHRRPNLY